MSGSTGWRRDPSGRHEWRYFVEDAPTSRVGDAGFLSEEAPPPEDRPAADPGPISGAAPVEDEPTPALPDPGDGSGVITAEPVAKATTPARATDPAPSSTEPRHPGWIAAALPLLGIYAAVRVGLLLSDALAAHLVYGRVLSGPLLAWDAHWYVQIANHGYPAHPAMASGHLTFSATNFLPFFPLLIRAVEGLGFSPAIAGSVVSWASGAASVLLVWRLGAMAFDEATGRLAAVLFTVFPGMGIAWGALYSECVGLALVAGCLLLLLRGGGAAGLLGMAATLTSPMAVVPLTAAAVVASVQAWRRREALLPPLLAVVLTPAGFFGYAAWVGFRYHDLLFYWHLGHQVWGTSIDFGQQMLTVLIHPMTQDFVGPGWLIWMGVVAVVGGIAAMWVARPPAVIVAYTGALLLQVAMTNVLGFKPRMLTWAFPALISVAALVRRRGSQPLVVGFAVLLPVVFLAYTTIGNTMGAP